MTLGHGGKNLTTAGDAETDRLMMTPLFSVALGGAVGASLRYLCVQGFMRLLGTQFPWGTLAVNVAGCFVMGLVFVFLAPHAKWAPLFMTGLLGGFTTFSAFSLDAVALFERGDAGLAVLYVLGSVLFSLMAVVIGILLARSLVG